MAGLGTGWNLASFDSFSITALTDNHDRDRSSVAGATPYNFRYIWFISIAAAMGGLLFGYDWVVIGGAKPFYETFFHLRSPCHGCLGHEQRADWLSVRRGGFAACSATSSEGNGCWSLRRSCSPSVRLGQERRAPSRCSSPGEYRAAWRSAWLQTFRRCTSRRSRRKACAGAWFL